MPQLATPRENNGGLDCTPSAVIPDFSPFITDGFVSLVGQTEKVPVKVLRDTGAFGTFVVGSVLPFSPASDTGEVMLVQGIGMEVLTAPIHEMILDSELVKGTVTVGVRHLLPVEGVQVILGND